MTSKTQNVGGVTNNVYFFRMCLNLNDCQFKTNGLKLKKTDIVTSQEYLLEKEMATHFSTLAWEIP